MRRMTLLTGRWAGALVLCAATAIPARAQNQQQLQTMADVRQLTELTAKLQASVNVLSDAVKDLTTKIQALGGRVDAQTTQINSMAATEKTLIDGLSTSLNALDLKVHDNNMNTQRLIEEMTAIRTGLSMLTDLITTLSQGQQPAAPAATGAGAPPPDAQAPPQVVIADSPGQMYQNAFGFYSRGQYDVAQGAFSDFLSKYPDSPDAPAGQFYIGMSFYNQAGAASDPAAKSKAYNDAIDAFTQVITKYKGCGCGAEPDAYYQRGLGYHSLKQDVKAKADWEKIRQEYASTKSPTWEVDDGLAKQMLQSIK